MRTSGATGTVLHASQRLRHDRRDGHGSLPGTPTDIAEGSRLLLWHWWLSGVWLNHLYRTIADQEERRGGTDTMARSRLRKACEHNLYGLDIDPHLVRTAQMNLVLHGDGSSNVFRADSARSPGEWPYDARHKVPYGKADVVLTNPPFGGNAKIDDSHILEQYELRSWESRTPRSSLPAEELFVEGAMRFLKPGGHLAIVLPRGILNNPKKSRFIRHWLLERSAIVASVDLPPTTFKASGGVPNPSLLIVRKFTPFGNGRCTAWHLRPHLQGFHGCPRNVRHHKSKEDFVPPCTKRSVPH